MLVGKENCFEEGRGLCRTHIVLNNISSYLTLQRARGMKGINCHCASVRTHCWPFILTGVYLYGVFQKQLHDGNPNVTVWRIYENIYA
jgi:hypothetical protein